MYKHIQEIYNVKFSSVILSKTIKTLPPALLIVSSCKLSPRSTLLARALLYDVVRERAFRPIGTIQQHGFLASFNWFAAVTVVVYHSYRTHRVGPVNTHSAVGEAPTRAVRELDRFLSDAIIAAPSGSGRNVDSIVVDHVADVLASHWFFFC